MLIETGRSSHQDLSDGLKQMPISMAIGIGQIGSRKMAVESQVIEQGPFGIETYDDISEAFPVSQLAETKCSVPRYSRELSPDRLVWNRGVVASCEVRASPNWAVEILPNGVVGMFSR